MTIQEFESHLKNLDSRIKIIYRPERFSDIAAVGLEGFPHAICTIPAPEIFETRDKDFKDSEGNVHATTVEVEGKVKNYLESIKDPDLLELEMTELDANGKEIKK